jgi:hypothetical protein
VSLEDLRGYLESCTRWLALHEMRRQLEEATQGDSNFGKWGEIIRRNRSETFGPAPTRDSSIAAFEAKPERS